MKLENLILGLIIVLLVIVLISFNVHAPAAILGLLGFYAISKDMKKEDYSGKYENNYTETSDNSKAIGGMNGTRFGMLEAHLNQFRETNFPFRFFDSANIMGPKTDPATEIVNATSPCVNPSTTAIDLSAIETDDIKEVLRTNISNKPANMNEFKLGNIVNRNTHDLAETFFVFEPANFTNFQSYSEVKEFISSVTKLAIVYEKIRDASILTNATTKLVRSFHFILNVRGYSMYADLYGIVTDHFSYTRTVNKIIATNFVDRLINKIRIRIDNHNAAIAGPICDFCKNSGHADPKRLLKHDGKAVDADFISKCCVFLMPNSVNIFSYKNPADIQAINNGNIPGPNGCPILRHSPLLYVNENILDAHFTELKSSYNGADNNKKFARDILYMSSNEKYHLNYSNLFANFIDIIYEYKTTRWDSGADMGIGSDMLYLNNYITINYTTDKYEIKNDPYSINIISMKGAKGFLHPSPTIPKRNVIELLHKILYLIQLMLFDLTNLINKLNNDNTINDGVSLLNAIINDVNNDVIQNALFDKATYINHLTYIRDNYDSVMINVFNVKYALLPGAASGDILEHNIIREKDLRKYNNQDLNPRAIMGSLIYIRDLFSLNNNIQTMNNLVEHMSAATVYLHNMNNNHVINNRVINGFSQDIETFIYYNKDCAIYHEKIKETDTKTNDEKKYNNITIYDHKSLVKNSFFKCTYKDGKFSHESEELFYQSILNLSNEEYSDSVINLNEISIYIYDKFRSEIKQLFDEKQFSNDNPDFIKGVNAILVDEKDISNIVEVLINYNDFITTNNVISTGDTLPRNPILDILMLLSNNTLKLTPYVQKYKQKIFVCLTKDKYINLYKQDRINYINFITANGVAFPTDDYELPISHYIYRQALFRSSTPITNNTWANFLKITSSAGNIMVQTVYISSLLPELLSFDDYKKHFYNLLNSFAFEQKINYNTKRQKNLEFIQNIIKEDAASLISFNMKQLPRGTGAGVLFNIWKSTPLDTMNDGRSLINVLSQISDDILKHRLIFLESNNPNMANEPRNWLKQFHHYFVGYDDLTLLSTYGYLHKKYKNNILFNPVTNTQMIVNGNDNYSEMILCSGDNYSDWFAYLMPNVATNLDTLMQNLNPNHIYNTVTNHQFDKHNSVRTLLQQVLFNVIIGGGNRNINPLHTDDQTTVINAFNAAFVGVRNPNFNYIDGKIVRSSYLPKHFNLPYIDNNVNTPLCVKFNHDIHIKKIVGVTSLGLIPYDYNIISRTALMNLDIVNIPRGNPAVFPPSRIQS